MFESSSALPSWMTLVGAWLNLLLSSSVKNPVPRALMGVAVKITWDDWVILFDVNGSHCKLSADSSLLSCTCVCSCSVQGGAWTWNLSSTLGPFEYKGGHQTWEDSRLLGEVGLAGKQRCRVTSWRLRSLVRAGLLSPGAQAGGQRRAGGRY